MRDVYKKVVPLRAFPHDHGVEEPSRAALKEREREGN